MTKCAETKRLVEWLRRSSGELGENNSELEKHVRECHYCQDRLTVLTDEPTLAPNLPAPDDLRYASEPQLEAMQKRIETLVQNEIDVVPNTPQTKVDTVVLSREETADDDHDQELSDFTNNFPSLDGFIFEQLIGIGGFSRVYLAWDVALSRNVAIKILNPHRDNSRNRQRFMREAQALAQLKSPYVVEIYHVDELDNGQPYIVMEYVSGGTFADLITTPESQAYELDQLANLFHEVAQGLTAAHQAGLVHRDIKPSNILVNDKGGAIHAKLADFGLAKNSAEDAFSLTQSAEIIGTPAFMSPEQVVENAKVDCRSDIYSLGATMYYCFTGQLPFSGSAVSVIPQIIDTEPKTPRSINASIPEDLETICLKAMAKKPSKRYQVASAMGHDIRCYIAGESISAKNPGRIELAFSWLRRHTTQTLTSILAAFTVAAAIVFSVMSWQNSKTASLAASNAAELSQRTNALESVKTQIQQRDDHVRQTLEGFFNKIVSDQTYRTTLPTHAKHEMVRVMLTQYEDYLKKQKDDRKATIEVCSTFSEVADFLLDSQMMFQANESIKASLSHLKPYSLDSNAESRELAITAKLSLQLFEVARFYNSKERDSIIEQADRFARQAVEKGGGYKAERHQIIAKGSKAAYIIAASDKALATTSLIECRQAIDELCQQHPGKDDLQIDRTRIRRWIGKLQPLEAASLRQESIDILEQLSQRQNLRNRQDILTRRLIALNRTYQGLAYATAGKNELAEATLETAITEMQQLIKKKPAYSQIRADLAETYVQLGNLLKRQQRSAGAYGKFESAIEAFQQLVTLDRHQASAIRRSAAIHQRLAKYHKKDGNMPESGTHFEASVKAYERLFSLDPLYHSKRDFQVFRKMIDSAANHYAETENKKRSSEYLTMSNEFVAEHPQMFQ